MNVYKLLLASLGLFSLLNYLVVPAATRTWTANRAAAKVSKVGVLALLNFVRTLSLVAFVAYAGLLLILLIINFFSSAGTTTAELGSAVERIQLYRDWLTAFRDYWGIWVFALAVLALGIFSYRREKQHVNKQFEKILKREYERLRGERERGLWDDIPPNPEMKEVEARILSARAQLAEPDKEVAAGGDRAKEKRDALLLLIQSLEHRWHAVDWERRMDFTWDPDLDEVTETNPSASSKVRTFLISVGLFDSLKAASRALTYAGTVLLFLSLLGINAPAVDYVLESRQVRLEELQVKASQEEAKSSLTRAQSAQNDGPKRERDQQDEETLNQVAQQFETAFTASNTWRTAGASPETTVRVRNALVRGQILEHFRRGTPQGAEAEVARAPQEAKVARAAQPGAVEEAGVELYEKATKAPADGPQTRLGRRAREDITREVVEKSKGFWERVKAKAREHVAKFGKPARIADVRDLAAGETVGALLDGFAGEANSEVVKLFQQSTTDSLQDATKRLYDIKFKQFLVELAGPGSMEDALRHVRTGTKQRPAVTGADQAQLQKVAERFPSNEGLAKNLEGRQPTLSRSLSNDQPSVEQIKKLYKNASAAVTARAEYTEAVAEYDDYFPGQLNSERQTTQGKLLDELGHAGIGPDSLPPPDGGGGGDGPPKLGGPPEGAGGGGGGGGLGGGGGNALGGETGSGGAGARGQTRPQTNSVTRMARSRSFSMLRGFARVGGVLIGQTPDEKSSPSVDFRDLDWRVSGEEVFLTLRRSDGEEFRLGPYKRVMVHQALAFVADGRKVAVTMTSARPLVDLKVITHPALVNSPLGTAVIELDRFVDIFSRNDQRSREAEARVDAQVTLYRFAWVKSQDALDGRLTEANIQRPQDEGVYLEMARSPEQEAQLKDRALPALLKPEDISDPRRSVLAAKPVFFNPELVKLIALCANKNRAPTTEDVDAINNFGGCIKSEVSAATRSADSSTLRRWTAAPPETINWSGVRELPFSIDSQLSFLSPASGTSPAAQLWPLEFMLQTAFPSPPAFLPEGEDPAIYTDQEPWDFPELKGVIAQDVVAGLRAAPTKKAIFAEMREFVILQRLFRVALEGKLGERFPVEKLINLIEATGGSIVYTRTPRWTPKTGALEFQFFIDIQPAVARSQALLVRAGDAFQIQWLTAPLKALGGCSELGVEAFGSPDKLSALGAISIDTWKQRCDLSPFEFAVSRKCESTSSYDSQVKPIACQVKSLILYSKEIAFARELRVALGVARDERLDEHTSP